MYPDTMGPADGCYDLGWATKLKVSDLIVRWRLQLGVEQGKQQLGGELQQLASEERLLEELMR